MSTTSVKTISNPPFLIAEIGVNHENNLEVAKNMISEAKKSGADAVKFQFYSAEKLASQEHAPAYWDTDEEKTASQFELFSRYDQFDIDQYRELSLYSASEGVEFMCTAFDTESIKKIDPLVSRHKIASADITNIPLLRLVSSLGKPVILSTGASTFEEIKVALDILSIVPKITLLHCVLRYPTRAENSNISRIRTLGSLFGDRAVIGYSDHVPSVSPLPLHPTIGATFLGAKVIEKHFTIDKTQEGNDHYHAFDPEEFLQLSVLTKQAWNYLGSGLDELEPQEKARQNARRRIFALKEISSGEILLEEHLIPLRANVGIGSEHWEKVIGTTTKREIRAGSPIYLEDLD